LKSTYFYIESVTPATINDSGIAIAPSESIGNSRVVVRNDEARYISAITSYAKILISICDRASAGYIRYRYIINGVVDSRRIVARDRGIILLICSSIANSNPLVSLVVGRDNTGNLRPILRISDVTR
jgi:hypothetical protein